MPHTLSELTGPVYGHEAVQEGDADLTKQHKGEPLGERIIVHGHVYDEASAPVPDTLVEIWQANACGRYVQMSTSIRRRSIQISPAPGRVVTDNRVTIVHHDEAGRYPGAITTMRGGRTTSIFRCSVMPFCRGW